MLADSLLISLINFHNAHLDRPDLANLTTTERAEYNMLVEKRAKLSVCYKENGKFSYHRLYDHYPKGPERDSVYACSLNVNAVDKRICELEANGSESHLVKAWSQDGPIDISKYYRQYKYSRDLKGNFLIHVICVCENLMPELERVPGFAWGSKFYTIEEKSSCVFSLHMDLSKHEAFGLYVHSTEFY